MPDDKTRELGSIPATPGKETHVTFEQSELILRMVETLLGLDKANRGSGFTPAQLLDHLARNDERANNMIQMCAELADIALGYFSERMNQVLDPINKHGPQTMHYVPGKGELQ